MRMPNVIKIPLVNGVAGTTHVKAGDQVQWTATVVSWVKPPNIFAGSHCSGTVSVPADGTPAPSNACHVTGQPGNYDYTSGVGTGGAGYPGRVEVGNDTIVIDVGASKPKP